MASGAADVRRYNYIYLKDCSNPKKNCNTTFPLGFKPLQGGIFSPRMRRNSYLLVWALTLQILHAQEDHSNDIQNPDTPITLVRLFPCILSPLFPHFRSQTPNPLSYLLLKSLIPIHCNQTNPPNRQQTSTA